MKNVRIIPRLDIKGPNLVKGIQLEGVRVLGSPNEFAKFYYENGADELLYMDVVASLYGRNSLRDIISEAAKDIYIPLTVGGGLRSLNDISIALQSGADKVSLNTAAIKDPSLIKAAVSKFGSSTIVVSIEAIKQNNGQYFAYIDNGREYTGINVVDWAIEVEKLGAGEILLTSVDHEGTGEGFDLDLVKNISSKVSISLIVHGGAGKMEDFKQVLDIPGVDGASAAGIFHYDFLKKNISKKDNFSEGNYEYLKSGRIPNYINTCSIHDLKSYLNNNNINCRL